MTRTKRWFIFAGVVCVAAAAGFVFLSTILSPYPAIDRAPEEANRVVHPAGFSIVRPGRTRAIVERASSVSAEQITILPESGRSRYTPVLSARRLGEPPDRSQLGREGFRPGEFQGQEALIYTGPSGEYDAHRVMTHRGGAWYEIALLIPGGDRPAGSLPSPEWQRYLDTFAPAVTPAAAATRPS